MSVTYFARRRSLLGGAGVSCRFVGPPLSSARSYRFTLHLLISSVSSAQVLAFVTEHATGAAIGAHPGDAGYTGRLPDL